MVSASWRRHPPLKHLVPWIGIRMQGCTYGPHSHSARREQPWVCSGGYSCLVLPMAIGFWAALLKLAAESSTTTTYYTRIIHLSDHAQTHHRSSQLHHTAPHSHSWSSFSGYKIYNLTKFLTEFDSLRRHTWSNYTEFAIFGLNLNAIKLAISA